jgi:hypothetical protein
MGRSPCVLLGFESTLVEQLDGLSWAAASFHRQRHRRDIDHSSNSLMQFLLDAELERLFRTLRNLRDCHVQPVPQSRRVNLFGALPDPVAGYLETPERISTGQLCPGGNAQLELRGAGVALVVPRASRSVSRILVRRAVSDGVSTRA